jgi:hypothetical protein
MIRGNFSNQTRSDAIISQENIDGFTNHYRERILEMLGTKYILDKKNSDSSDRNFPVDEYLINYEDDIWRVFKDIKAADRIFFAKKVNFYSNPKDFENKFFSKDFNLKTDILTENNSFSTDEVSQIGSKGTLQLLQYSPNQVIIKTKSDGKQVLFISDSYYPGWKASIDNKQAKIIKANYAFRAIAIPKGEHEIKMIYSPDSFKIGLLVSLSSFALLLILCILYSRNELIKKA